MMARDLAEELAFVLDESSPAVSEANLTPLGSSGPEGIQLSLPRSHQWGGAGSAKVPGLPFTESYNIAAGTMGFSEALGCILGCKSW